MNLLDDIAKVKAIDKSNALDSITAFPEQIKDVWQQFDRQHQLQGFSDFQNIIVTGMGGSALAGRIIKDLYADELALPFEVITEYHLPSFVNNRSLVIVSSYSGNTEETISSLNDAQTRSAKIFCVTTGGRIGQLIKEQKVNGFIYQPSQNPLGYPKTAIGYSLGSLLRVMSYLKIIKLEQSRLDQALDEFIQVQKTFLIENESKSNPIKIIADEISGRIPFFVASQHLKGAAYAARNQIHEISHANSFFFDLPEMNHHQTEALGKPSELIPLSTYLYILSDHYHERNQKRYQATAEILSQFNLKKLEYPVKTRAKLAQALEVVNLGGFLSFYLSILAQEDPGPEPWIIYLKKILKG